LIAEGNETGERRRSWLAITENYSSRTFTFFKDRPAAIAGLIQAYSAHDLSDTSILGLWEETLWADLGWHRPNERTDLVSIPELAKYPSWTWLSHRGEVRASRIGFHKNLRLVLKKWGIVWKTTLLTSSLLSFELSVVSSLRTFKSVKAGSLVAYQQREILMRRSGDPLLYGCVPTQRPKLSTLKISGYFC